MQFHTELIFIEQIRNFLILFPSATGITFTTKFSRYLQGTLQFKSLVRGPASAKHIEIVPNNVSHTILIQKFAILVYS